MEELIHLLKLDKDSLKEELYKRLGQIGMSPVNEDGYLYAEGDLPVLLVAHVDTVFKEPPKRLDINEDVISNPEGGLGGDDRCGVYAILKLLEKYSPKRPHVLFTEDEEIGCIGARKAAENLPKPDVKYMIEIDRRGKKDCVFYTCGNKEFAKYVETFGFKTQYGTNTDIVALGEKWDIAGVNLSSGYYNEHTTREHVKFKELQKTIERIDNMIKDLEKAPYYDHQTVLHSFRTYRSAYWDYWDEDDEYGYSYYPRYYGGYATQYGTNNYVPKGGRKYGTSGGIIDLGNGEYENYNIPPRNNRIYEASLTESEKQSKIDEFLKSNKAFDARTPRFITENEECAKASIERDIDSYNFIGVPSANLKSIVSVKALTKRYILHGKSPFFLKENYAVALNSISLDVKSADYVEWYKICSFDKSKTKTKNLIDKVVEKGYVLHEGSPYLLKKDNAVALKSINLDVNSADFFVWPSSSNPDDVQNLINTIVEKGYVLHSESPFILSENYAVVLKSISLDVNSADYVDWQRFGNKEEKTNLINTIIQKGYILHKKSPFCLKDNYAVILNSISLDVNSADYVDWESLEENNTKEEMDELLALLIEKGYVLNENSPFYLAGNYEVAKNSINLDVNSANYVYWKRIGYSSKDNDGEKDKLVDLVIEKGYVLSSKSPNFLLKNPRVILCSLKKDINTCCFLPDVVFNNHKVFKYAITHGANLSLEFLKKRPLNQVHDQTILRYLFEKSRVYKDGSDLYKDRVDSLFIDALNTLPTIETYKSLFLAIAYKRLKDSNIRKSSKEIIFTVLRDSSSFNDVMRFIEDFKETIGDKYKELCDAMQNYYELYHSNLPYRFSKLRPYKDIIDSIIALNTIDEDELFIKQQMAEYNSWLRQFFTFRLDNPVVQEQIKKMSTLLEKNDLDCNSVEITKEWLFKELPFTDEYFEFDKKNLSKFLFRDLYETCLCVRGVSLCNPNSILDDEAYDTLYNILVNKGFIWLIILLYGVDCTYKNRNICSYGITEEKIAGLINRAKELVTLMRKLDLDINNYGDLLLLIGMNYVADSRNIDILGLDVLEEICSNNDDLGGNTKDVVTCCQKLVMKMAGRSKSTVPYVSGEKEILYVDGETKKYKYSLYDSQDVDVLLDKTDISYEFRVNGQYNDLFHYCCLDKNGFIIKITDKDGNFIGRTGGFRNGNCVFLNKLETIQGYSCRDVGILELLIKACEDIVRTSQENELEKDKIDHVFAPFFAPYSNKNIESNITFDVMDKIGYKPMEMASQDWEDFIDNNKNILNESTYSINGFYTDYRYYDAVCMASIKEPSELNPEDLRFGDVEAVYERTRNKIIATTNIDSNIIRKIKKIKGIDSYINGQKNEEVIVPEGATVFVGDNWYIIYCYCAIVESCVLDCDEKAKREFELTCERLSKESNELVQQQVGFVQPMQGFLYNNKPKIELLTDSVNKGNGI